MDGSIDRSRHDPKRTRRALGSLGRPDRDRTVHGTIDLQDPVVVEIAKEFKVHLASIAIDWVMR